MNLWRTKNGRSIDIGCMACDHLRNCIALILRTGWRLRWLDVLTDEYQRRCNKPPQWTDPKEKETSLV